jgi:hypothetical protein
MEEKEAAPVSWLGNFIFLRPQKKKIEYVGTFIYY